MRVPSLACSCLCPILVLSTSFWGWGGGYIKFWSCQIYHKNFCQISNFFIPGVASIFDKVNFAIKIFAMFLHFAQLLSLGLLGQSSEVECNAKMSISFFDDLVANFFAFQATFVTQNPQLIIKS